VNDLEKREAEMMKVFAEIMEAYAGKTFSTQCETCSQNHTGTLDWFRERNYRCPSCDGILEDRFLHKIVSSWLRKARKPVKRPRKRKKVPKRDESSEIPGTRYQLVLQFQGDLVDDYDKLIALEEQLIEELGESAEVDGHDFGSGEFNIFIFTTNPADIFLNLKPILTRAKVLEALIAAYRPVEGEDYTVIFPKNFKGCFDVT
jgi:hypothetical protein